MELGGRQNAQRPTKLVTSHRKQFLTFWKSILGRNKLLQFHERHYQTDTFITADDACSARTAAVRESHCLFLLRFISPISYFIIPQKKSQHPLRCNFPHHLLRPIVINRNTRSHCYISYSAHRLAQRKETSSSSSNRKEWMTRQFSIIIVIFFSSSFRRFSSLFVQRRNLNNFNLSAITNRSSCSALLMQYLAKLQSKPNFYLVFCLFVWMFVRRIRQRGVEGTGGNIFSI